MEYLQVVAEVMEQLTPEGCDAILKWIKQDPDSFFAQFPDPKEARAIFAEEGKKFDKMDELLNAFNDLVHKLEQGTATQKDVDGVVYASFRCALLNPDQPARIAGYVTGLKTAVDRHPMKESASSEAELNFWNKMAVGGFIHKQAMKDVNFKPIPETYEKVRELARTIKELILSEEDNGEIGLSVKIVPDKPIPHLDENGKVVLPDTPARINIVTDDVLSIPLSMKDRIKQVIASATECNAISAGIMAHGEYGISMQIFCNIPVFSWSEYPTEHKI